MNKNKGSILNVIIILYNLITTLINSSNGYISYFSIVILAVNIVLSVASIKNNGKTVSEIICIILEVITGLVILFTII